jgi:hypothetical protein
MTKNEIFLRPASEIFAGIMCLFQEDFARQGGKIAVTWAF